MIRFALIVASTLGFVLTAALGNLMTPLLRAFRVRQEENEPPTMGGLCLMVGTLAAVHRQCLWYHEGLLYTCWRRSIPYRALR